MKKCSRCKKRPRSTTHAWCKLCQSEYHKERKRLDPTLGPYLAEHAKEFRRTHPRRMKALYRRHNLKNNSGATVEWYEEQFKKQKRRCAICRAKAKSVRKGGIPRLSVDHDHRTGTRRALLCAKCNFALSRIEEVPQWARKATQYLKKHSF